MITRVIMLLVLFVLLVNLVLHRPLLESFLFSVALAVGMTPEMMPMIITVTLAQGARRMTKKKVLVKQLAAIEDFGSVEILCSDKTGTLTEGEIVLDRHVDVQGKDDDECAADDLPQQLLRGGHQEPAGRGDLEHERPGHRGVREGGRDPIRLRPQAALRGGATRRRAPPRHQGRGRRRVRHLQPVAVDGTPQPFDDTRRAQAAETFQKLSAEGYRTLGVAVLKVDKQDAYTPGAERGMTLVGFAAFLDPPKEGIPAVLEALEQNGVSVVIMTGDNQYVTRKVAHDVGLRRRPHRHRQPRSTRWTMPPWPTRRRTAPSSPACLPSRRTG